MLTFAPPPQLQEISWSWCTHGHVKSPAPGSGTPALRQERFPSLAEEAKQMAVAEELRWAACPAKEAKWELCVGLCG